MDLQLAEHDPRWAVAFAAEARRIGGVLGDCPIAWEHIGSTAVPGLLAKPIVDMLGTTADLAAIDRLEGRFLALGYRAKGENGIAGRRYFSRLEGAGPTGFHLHVFAHGSPHAERHLAFRDFLRVHPKVAADYAERKRALRRAGATRAEYQERKAPFVREVEARALAWFRAGR